MMKTILPAPARLAAAFLAAALLSMSLAHAQERRERREHERERFQTPHWVFDDRFHHNHYYPAVVRWPSRRWWRARTRRLRRPRPAAPHRRVPRGPGTTAPRRRPTTPTSPSARRAGGAFRPRRRRRVERKLAASSERNFSFERNFFGASLFELLESAKHEAGGQVDGGRAGGASERSGASWARLQRALGGL